MGDGKERVATGFPELKKGQSDKCERGRKGDSWPEKGSDWPATVREHSSRAALSQDGLTETDNRSGHLPILRSWAVKVQEEELLPDERQKRVIRRCDKSLVGPAINQEPLERRDDGELQLGLGFLQKRRGFEQP